MPLQEMSDARQAVRAAENAGAQKYAPELLAEAKSLVETARQNMQKGEYRQARDEAVLARDKATEARRVAETASAGGTAP
jgi:predicted S18 family serine protease